MNIGKLIGKGATAEVFDYENDKVIKLYNLGESKNSLMWEYNRLKEAHKNNVPCPKVFDIVEVEGRHGYVMEKYHGLTMKEKLLSDIQKVIIGEMSIELFTIHFFDDIKGVARALYEIHKIRMPEWDKLYDRLLWEVKSTELLLMKEKKLIIDLIENLPEDSVVCHGDINPNNIMICESEYKFIDWVNAGIGNPLYDIAEYVWLNTPKEDANVDGVPQELIDFFYNNKDLIIKTFLNEYEKVSATDVSSYNEYTIPLLVRKLHSNRTDSEKSKIVIEIRERLSNYYDGGCLFI